MDSSFYTADKKTPVQDKSCTGEENLPSPPLLVGEGYLHHDFYFLFKCFFRASTFSCLGRKYFSSAFYRVAMASSNSEAPSGATPVIHGNRRMTLSIRSYRYHRIHFTTLQFFSLCKIPFDFRVKKSRRPAGTH